MLVGTQSARKQRSRAERRQHRVQAWEPEPSSFRPTPDPDLRMPLISWSRRAPFGRQKSASSDESGTETIPQHIESLAADKDGTLAGVSDVDQGRLQRRGTKRGIIQNLLSRTQTKGRSATKPSTTTSAPKAETSAEKRKRSPSSNGRPRAKTVAAGDLLSPALSKPRSASTSAVSVPIDFRHQVMVAGAIAERRLIHTVTPSHPRCSFPIFPAAPPPLPCSLVAVWGQPLQPSLPSAAHAIPPAAPEASPSKIQVASPLLTFMQCPRDVETSIGFSSLFPISPLRSLCILAEMHSSVAVPGYHQHQPPITSRPCHCPVTVQLGPWTPTPHCCVPSRAQGARPHGPILP